MKEERKRLESNKHRPGIGGNASVPFSSIPHPSSLSVVVPVLDEAGTIESCLRALAPLRARGAEVIVVDGGSSDATTTLAAPWCDRVTSAARGRAAQMNAGAIEARGDVLLFLHADTTLPPDADRLVLEGMRASGRRWGRFDVRLSGTHPLLRVVERSMNWRSRLTAIATGDQGLFIERALFGAVGGFASMPLMEDIELSRRLRRHGRPLCLRAQAVASSRRWENHGVLRTILLMWRLRLAYFLGADPVGLARIYYRNEH